MGEVVIKFGQFIKRSQNKKRFTPINYKLRYFELTNYHLIYFDNFEVKEVIIIIIIMIFFIHIILKWCRKILDVKVTIKFRGFSCSAIFFIFIIIYFI